MAAQTILGLDIGSSNIRAVVLDNSKQPPRLISLGKIASPAPGINSEADFDIESLAQTIKLLVTEIKSPTKDTVISLPESKIFTRVIYDLPFLTNEELSHAMRFAAEEFVPMPIQDVNLNYQILYRSAQKGPNSRTVVLIIATPKLLLDKYLKILTLAELKPLAIETELIAASRSLVTYSDYSPTTLILQMSNTTTDYAIVSGGLILLTRSISTGSTALTRAIAQSFGFEFAQAEEYKKVYGLNESQLEGKLFSVLRPLVNIIVAETRKVIQSFETLNPSNPIKRVVLSGGGASLPGLVIYMANSLALEVQEADPWASVAHSSEFNQKLASDASSFSVAVGLAQWHP